MTNVYSNNTPQTTQTPTLNAAFFAAQKHPFHILGPSALPVLTGFFLFCWLVPLTFYMHGLPLPIFDTFRSDLIHMSFIDLLGVGPASVSYAFFPVLVQISRGLARAPLSSWLTFQAAITFIILSWYKNEQNNLSLFPKFALAILAFAIIFHELLLPVFTASSSEIVSLSWWISRALSHPSYLQRAVNWLILVLLSIFLAFVNLILSTIQTHSLVIDYNGAIGPLFLSTFLALSLLLIWFESLKSANIHNFLISLLFIVFLFSLVVLVIIEFNHFVDLLAHSCYYVNGQFTNIVYKSDKITVLTTQLSQLKAEEAYQLALNSLDGDAKAIFKNKQAQILDLLRHGNHERATAELQNSIYRALNPVKPDVPMPKSKIRAFDPSRFKKYLHTYIGK